MRAHHELDAARREPVQHPAPVGAAGRSRQQRHLVRARRQQPPDRQVMLLGEDLGRRHERDLQAVLHRDHGRQQRHDRLARADIALQQPLHRRRPRHVADDVLEGQPLCSGQRERQHRPRRGADAVVDDRDDGLPLRDGGPPPESQPDLEQQELFENHAHLCRRSKRVQQVERRVGGREMRLGNRRPPIRKAHLGAQPVRQHVGRILGQLLHHVVDERPLHAARGAPGLLVDRHDAARVDGVTLPPAWQLVLRIGDLQRPGFATLGGPVQNDVRPPRDDVGHERLVQPDRLDRTGRVTDDGFEQLEARAPGQAHPAGHDRSRHGHRLPRPHARHLAEPRAVFIPERKPREQVADRPQACLREVRPALRAHALERQERRLERHVHWMMMARLDSTVISRMPPVSANGASRLYPSGFAALLV